MPWFILLLTVLSVLNLLLSVLILSLLVDQGLRDRARARLWPRRAAPPRNGH